MAKRTTLCPVTGKHDSHIWRQPVSIYTDDGGPTMTKIEIFCPGLTESSDDV